MIINGYTLEESLKNANSGFSKWGFATKDGKAYFVKELISPVYPMNPSMMSEELFRRKRAQCHQYETKMRLFLERINKASRGNLVRIVDFFRCGSRYYLVSEKIAEKAPSVESVACLEHEKKLLFLRSVVQCFCDLHSVGIVHADVKPDNILIAKSQNGKVVAKLIDFDSGFMEGSVSREREFGGELTHLAPETFLGISGADVQPERKSDIFSLGLVLHEYYCGALPEYDEQYEYPYEAVLDESFLRLHDKIPKEVATVLSAMLENEPQKRPSAEEIVRSFGGILRDLEEMRETEGTRYGAASQKQNESKLDRFRPAGDL